MGAKSNKIKDIREWIVDVIDSCNTIVQAKSTTNLIFSFKRFLLMNGFNDVESRKIISKLLKKLSIKKIKIRENNKL